MTWLAIDTATASASVALGASSSQCVEESLAGARQHASALIGMVDRLLTRAGQTLIDVDGLIVADGPGSFTGLRVAAAFAKGLCDTRTLELRTAPSLAASAASVALESGTARRTGPGAPQAVTVAAVANALRGDVYVAAYRFGSGRCETVVPPGVIRANELEALAVSADRVVGELPPALIAALGDRYAGAAPPSASALLDLRLLEGGTRLISDVHAWEPVYGRPAEAQAKWELAHGRSLPGAAGARG